MEQTGIFSGRIVGAGTKLRTEHSNSAGNATVIATYGAGLAVVANKKWTCEVADLAKNWQVGDVWIYVTKIGGIDVVDGWMAVKHHGADIVTLDVDLPDVVVVDPPYDNTVTNSVTLDFNAQNEVVGVWVGSQEYVPAPPALPPVG